MYLYHCTSTDRVVSIQNKGLQPSVDPHWGGELGDTSLGKVFFADSPEHAYYYGEIVFRDTLQLEGLAGAPILLRVRNLQGMVQDKQDTHAFYATRVIPPQAIEIMWHGWKPIKSAGGYWDEMGTASTMMRTFTRTGKARRSIVWKRSWRMPKRPF